MGLAMKLSETRAFAPLDQRSLTRTRGVLPSAGKCIRAMGALPPSRDTQRRWGPAHRWQARAKRRTLGI